MRDSVSTKRKQTLSLSVDKKIDDMLHEYCEKNSINKSKLVNKIIFEFLRTKNISE